MNSIKEYFRKKRLYKELCQRACWEANHDAPYDLDVGFAFTYLDVGKIEEYFQDIQAIAAKKLEKQRMERGIE